MVDSFWDHIYRLAVNQRMDRIDQKKNLVHTISSQKSFKAISHGKDDMF